MSILRALQTVMTSAAPSSRKFRFRRSVGIWAIFLPAARGYDKI